MNCCGWATDDLAIRDHDEVWGVPVHDDRRSFEFNVLEGAQAGLTWDTILRKREHDRRAFADFDSDADPCSTTPGLIPCWPTPELCGTASRSHPP
jgi:DNA-3-methyladenine glycosylase I